jgi:26S proteasome regulatory subunit (ATPase 3-interacting protein)
MRGQNRPYNNKMIFENLHGAVGQAQVTKAMDDLAERGELVRKENGKQKVYWPAQETDEIKALTGPDSAASAAALDAEAQAAKEQAAAHKAKADALAAENKRIAAQPADADAAALVARLTEETARMEARLKALRESTVKVSRDDFLAAEKRYQAAKAAWKKRKRMCKDVMAALTESSGQSIADLAEEVGIETDESLGITDIDDDTSTQMRKRPKTGE